MNPKRPMPEDFLIVAPGKSQQELAKIYHSAFRTVRRWKIDAGLPHAYGKTKRTKKRVAMYSTDGEKIMEFEDAKAAANYIYVSVEAIRACCNGRSKTCAGKIFKYCDIAS